MTTERKPRVQKPDAEVVGSFADVMKRGPCVAGRNLFAFCNDDGEVYVLAATELQAFKERYKGYDTITKIAKGTMSERYRQEYLKLMEEQANGETDGD